ncbi:dnaJ homolog subfamily C member 1 isoform 2-T2 [Pholidichthys leucotaenia]
MTPSPLLILTLLVSATPLRGWDLDLELLDLVEEVPQSFYQFLNVDQHASSSEIKKAYRRLSLLLHPDKNKEENAETQFRQLVSIYEVLKDEDRRRRYDEILEKGLPDWRQPVFYYRRVRKMNNGELAILLFIILTVGHYAVLWSIYLEKQLDELLSKKKKEKKKKQQLSRPAEELRIQDRPRWYDVLPLKITIWIYLSIRNLPQTVQEVRQFYEDYQQLKQQQKQEVAEAEQEAASREKRPKVKKPRVEFPIYEPSPDQNRQDCFQTTSIEDVEDQMDNWLQDHPDTKKKAADWTEDDLSLLSRLMVKFPGGTPGRWEKIAHELGRTITQVTTKVKQVKDNVTQKSGLVKLSELKAPPLQVRSLLVDDSVMTQRVDGAYEDQQEEVGPTVRRRNRKSSADGAEVKVRSRRQRDFDSTVIEEDDDQEAEPNQRVEPPEKVEPVMWTQNQQKLLELALQQFPRGTAERWDRIAKVVPGKTKEECVVRYKMLAELIQRRKQAKS